MAPYVGPAGLSSPQFVNLDPQLPDFDFGGGQAHDGKTELHRAVIDQNQDSVKTLLFSGVPVNVRDNLGNEPLHYAVLAGEVGTVRLLLRFGANANAKSTLNRSPLHLAVSSLELVEMLLREGAVASEQDENGDTPLHLSLSEARLIGNTTPPLVDALVVAGCDVNIANEAGLTPFLKFLATPHKGQTFGYLWMTLYFLQHGGSVTKSLPDGRTPLQIFLSQMGDIRNRDRWQANRENEVLCSFLEKGAPVDATTTLAGYPLVIGFLNRRFVAYNDNDAKLAKALCERTGPEADLGRGNTLLYRLMGMWRVKNNGVEPLVEALLQQGANPNRRNLDGQTPLAILLEHPGTEGSACRIVERLVAKGAEVSQKGIIQAALLFPHSEAVLRPLLQAHLQQLGAAPPPPAESHATLEEQQWWDDWVQAARGWDRVKQLITSQNRVYPGDAQLARVALAVLAERLIQAFKDEAQASRDMAAVSSDGGPAFPGNQEARKEKGRGYVSDILRTCRQYAIPVDMECFDYLLELCKE